MLRDQIEHFWARELGCTVEAIVSPGPKAVRRIQDDGAFIFRYATSCIWHVPARFMPVVENRLVTHRNIDDVFCYDFIDNLFGTAAQLILGPCPIAYCDETMLRIDQSRPTCRELTGADSAAIKDLANACGEEAWEHGGIELETQQAVFGCFAGDELVSASSYEIWGNTVAHVGVATAPKFRKRGFAQAVAAASTADALGKGLLPQWRTLESNAASIGVGKALGYEDYGIALLCSLRIVTVGAHA